MEADDLLPLKPGDPLAQLVRQDLDPLSQEELVARVGVLEGEIARTKARMRAAAGHRAIAEELFRR